MTATYRNAASTGSTHGNLELLYGSVPTVLQTTLNNLPVNSHIGGGVTGGGSPTWTGRIISRNIYTASNQARVTIHLVESPPTSFGSNSFNILSGTAGLADLQVGYVRENTSAADNSILLYNALQ